MLLHIDPEKVWQGGQRQVVYLVDFLNKSGYESVIACRNNTPMAEYCKNNDLPFIEFDFQYKLNPRVILKLSSFCRKYQIKIIHCHSSHALTIGIQLKILLPEVKLVASRRVDFSINGKISAILKYKNPLLDRLICISQNIINVCRNDGIPQHKLKLIYSGIDTSRLAKQIPPDNFIESLNLPEHNLIIGTIAALVYHKDYQTLIKAAAIVLKKHPETLFLALGKGQLLNDLTKMTIDLGIDKRFLFMGFRKEVGWFLNSFDIFTLSSKLEGLGTSVLDALSCGKACVCTRGGGIPEMITNKVNGLLVPVKDYQKLADAFCCLIENPEERERLSRTALRSVNKFSAENTAKQHIALYKEILSEKV